MLRRGRGIYGLWSDHTSRSMSDDSGLVVPTCSSLNIMNLLYISDASVMMLPYLDDYYSDSTTADQEPVFRLLGP